jgi:hypothetical protein
MAVQEGCTKQAILNEDVLLRRVSYLDPNYVKPDGSASSFAFTLKKRAGVKESGLSVDVERLTTYERSILRASDYRLYALTAADARGLGLCVCHDPCPPEDPGNKAHTLITGKEGRPEDCSDETCVQGADAKATISTSLARALARASKRINYPDRC